MKLIDVDVLHKEMRREIKDMVTEEDKECMRYADSVIDNVSLVKAIPVEWLHRKLIDLMYDGKATEEALHVFHRLIGDWEKQNESNSSN